MRFFDAMIKILKKPFPELESSMGVLKINAAISIFVVFFLYVFQPFGISVLEADKFLICLGFGIMTFGASALFEFTVRVLKLKGELADWTFGKWIGYNLGAMLTISLANFLFARILIFGFIEWELLPHMIYGTFMIGIIPITVIGGISVTLQEKKYTRLASDINDKKNAFSTVDSSEEYYLYDIPVSRIKYVEALQNYVFIGYTNAEGQFKKSTERATLKGVLEEVSGSSIIMAHRSFLVNQRAIISISGNAQGLLLTLSEADKSIPVSRSYVSVFRGR